PCPPAAVTRGGPKVWFGTLTASLDFDDLVEPRVAEEVLQVAIDACLPYLATGGEQPLLRLEKHSQACARDIFESAAIESHRSFDTIEKGLRARRFGCVQATDDGDAAAARYKINRKHCLRLYWSRARKRAFPIAFF